VPFAALPFFVAVLSMLAISVVSSRLLAVALSLPGSLIAVRARAGSFF
jgi:hypothetical protein